MTSTIHLALAAANSREDRVIHGAWDGFKAIPVQLWHALPHHNLATPYHLAYILGLILFVAVLAYAAHRA